MFVTLTNVVSSAVHLVDNMWVPYLSYYVYISLTYFRQYLFWLFSCSLLLLSLLPAITNQLCKSQFENTKIITHKSWSANLLKVGTEIVP